MTTHTDLIARLREMAGRLRLEAADALEAQDTLIVALQAQMYADRRQALVWRDQVAALTKDKEQLAVHLAEVSSQSLLRIYAAQAREAKRLKTISDEATAIAFYGDQPPQWMLNLIAIPADDSALQERLKQEREKCANVCEQMTIETVGASNLTADQCAREIRGMK